MAFKRPLDFIRQYIKSRTAVVRPFFRNRAAALSRGFCTFAGASILIGILARSWVLSFVPAVDAMERFSPPDENQRRSAIGTATGLPKVLQRDFDPTGHFEPIPAPGPSGWLANHREPGQTFEQYRREWVNRPDKTRRKLYLQPWGEFPAATSPDVNQLTQFAEAFFTLPVELRSAVDLAGLPITSRTHPSTRKRQLLTSDILAWLQTRVPKEAYCTLPIAMADLYPADDWSGLVPVPAGGKSCGGPATRRSAGPFPYPRGVARNPLSSSNP